MTEDEFWQTHTVLTNEVEATEESYFVQKEVNEFVGSHPEALRRMQRNPLFWVVTRHALQTSFIIIMGRVFDRDKRSHSIHRLLDEAVRHQEYFSKDALRRHKLALSPSFNLAELDQYVAEAWEPEAADLVALRDRFQLTSNKYDSSFKLIRHKLYAHQDILSRQAIRSLVSKGLLVDFEAILYGLHDVLDCLFQLHVNGVRPELGKRTYGYEDRVRTDVRETLKLLLSSSSS